ncbi:MAG: IS630 family transposase [Chloroflexi bacterium]|nr:IS630 family transposase [Chloroflexota bacterium]
MVRQEIGRVATRANLILLSSFGYTVSAIAGIYQTSKVTIYKWFDRFDAEGPMGLYDKPRSGRPAKVTQAVEDFVKKALAETPHKYGENCTIWTVALLQTHLKNELGLQLSGKVTRQTIHNLGFRWRRPRWAAVRKDPLEAQIMQGIARVSLNRNFDVQAWLQDETKFRTLPPLRQMWMQKGRQVRIPTPKVNEKFYSYGALNLDNGAWFDAFFDQVNSNSTIAYLDALLNTYPNTAHILIWDQARYHTSRKVEIWIAKQERLSILLLPKYAAELNPVESIWRIVKQRVAANLTRLVDALKEAYLAFFEEKTAEDLLQFAGLTL